jgi:hypothetical protein
MVVPVIRVKRPLAILIAAAGLLAAAPAVALAEQSPEINFHYYGCVGPAGTPESFDAEKLQRNASALHVVGTNEIWMLVTVQSVANGQVLISMPPAFLGNEPMPLVTCLIFSPVRFELLSVTGFFQPVSW